MERWQLVILILIILLLGGFGVFYAQAQNQLVTIPQPQTQTVDMFSSSTGLSQTLTATATEFEPDRTWTPYNSYNNTEFKIYGVFNSTVYYRLPPFEIDPSGSYKNSTSGKVLEVTLSTTLTNDIIYVMFTAELTGSTFATPTDTSHLTWELRDSSHGKTPSIGAWWALSTSALTNDHITASITSTGGNLGIIAFGISGANTTNPFDPNAQIPTISSGSSNAPSVTISTSNANDMLLADLGGTGTPTVTVPSGFTAVGTFTAGPVAGVAYKIVTSTQTAVSMTYSLSISETWGMIGDAVVKAQDSGGIKIYVQFSTDGGNNWFQLEAPTGYFLITSNVTLTYLDTSYFLLATSGIEPVAGAFLIRAQVAATNTSDTLVIYKLGIFSK